MGIPRLSARRIARVSGGAKIAHAWSPAAALAAKTYARRARCGAILSLPHRPAIKDLRLVRRLARKGRCHVTVPTHIAKFALLWGGLDESTVHILNPCAERIEYFEEKRRRTRQALGIGDEQYLLIAPSQMVRGAGHKYASWAHAIIRQIRDDIRLLLPGAGPAEQSVRSFAATTGYDEEVFLTGNRFSREEVLAASDIALFLAERDIGVSALAAAIVAELPIVASNVPETAEFLPHEVARLMPPVRDPRAVSAVILRILEEPGLVYQQVAAVKKQAEKHFDPQTTRKTLAEIYDAAMPPSPVA
jgi:glycosyltransferase involved in cell wall biosynthesis